MITVLSAVLASSVSAVVSKIVDNGLSELFMKPVLRLQLISLLAIFRERSLDRVHEDRVITYHINHLYRLYQD